MTNKEMLDEIEEKIKKILREVLGAMEDAKNEYGSMYHKTNQNCYIAFKSNQILSLETDTCRVAVVRKEGEIPDPDPHSYEGEFEAMCAVKEAAYKAGFIQEVKSE